MNFEYEINNKDIRYMYLVLSKKINWLYFVIMFIIFALVLKDILFVNLVITFIMLIIYTLLTLLFVTLINYLFAVIMTYITNQKICNKVRNCKVQINEREIKETIDGTCYQIKWIDVSKIDIKNNYVLIYSKKKDMVLFFRREIFPKYQDFIMTLIEYKK